MIPVKEACEKLGISDTAICISKKYAPFYKSASKGKHNAMFDIKGYRERQILISELVEKSKLLVEYLRHIENMTYKEITRLTKVAWQTIYSLDYGEGVAYRIVSAIAYLRPFHLKRFDEYYGFKIMTYRKTIQFKTSKFIKDEE